MRFSQYNTLISMKNLLKSALLLAFIGLFSQPLLAQLDPTLSIQGILTKSNGVAVSDGNYNLVFKLYTAPTGGMAIWTETQSSVEVSNGIYSAVLGVVTPLNIPFDQLYYLGVTVGSTELSPRILLTSAPYALSLIGQTNKFPSSGKVLADSIQVNGGVLARGGTPGLNGANRNGYAFSGNSGDKDSGVFSTGNGEVSLYSNNTEIVEVTPTNVISSQPLTVQGIVTANGVNISSNNSLSYNGLSDWRLVDVDDFTNGADGWNFYDKLTNQQMGWNNATSSGASPIQDMGNFIGNILLPTSNDHVLKKQFSPGGSFTQIKVKFRYYYIDTWGWGGGDRSWAAFSNTASGNGLRVGWTQMPAFLNDGNNDFNVNGLLSFGNQANFFGQTGIADNWIDAEMTANVTGSFWLFIGAAVDMDVADERFGVGAVEVYVR
ncbi:MAG: hypothetical protein Q7U74_11765 [Saprospiraceae bacterium]|nr:hypothetical protein [Saprospiraceae bacterium]